MHNEASNFEVPCHSCLMPGLMKLCQTNIPHFSDLIIMSFSCDYCGAHSTDTKTSGVITDKSTNITLNAK
jgi:zinc finger protein